MAQNCCEHGEAGALLKRQSTSLSRNDPLQKLEEGANMLEEVQADIIQLETDIEESWRHL